MKSYELRYYGDPVLRKKAEPIEKITQEIRDLAQQMIQLMEEHKGCGLAATQVGALHRLFVSNVDREDEKGEVHLGEPKVYINPVISNPSKVLVEQAEGCLSIPKLSLPIERPLSITIEFTDLEGNHHTKECYGFLARNMMHENDHLNGVLHVDRYKGDREALSQALRKIKRTYYKG